MANKVLTPLQKGLIACALFLALAIRLDVAMRDTSVPEKDAHEYDQIAMNLLQGAGYRNARGELTAYRLPGYPLFLAAIYGTVGHNYQAARVVQALLSTVTVWLIALWAFVLFGGWSACWAAFLAAVYPSFYAYYFSCSVLVTETYYAFLLTGTFFTFFLHIRFPSWLTAFLSGIFWALAVMTRGVAFPLLILLPIILVLLRYRLRQILRYHLVIWSVVGLALAPWVIRNHIVFGSFIPLTTNAGENFYISNHAGSDGLGGEFFRRVIVPEDEKLRIMGFSELERSRYFFDQGMSFIRSRPKEAAKLFIRKIFLYLDPTERSQNMGSTTRVINIAYVIAAFGSVTGFMLVLQLDKRFLKPICLMAFLFLYFLFFHAFYHSGSRYRFPTESILIVVASYVLSRMIEIGLKRRNISLMP